MGTNNDEKSNLEEGELVDDCTNDDPFFESLKGNLDNDTDRKWRQTNCSKSPPSVHSRLSGRLHDKTYNRRSPSPKYDPMEDLRRSIHDTIRNNSGERDDRDRSNNRRKDSEAQDVNKRKYRDMDNRRKISRDRN